MVGTEHSLPGQILRAQEVIWGHSAPCGRNLGGTEFPPRTCGDRAQEGPTFDSYYYLVCIQVGLSPKEIGLCLFPQHPNTQILPHQLLRAGSLPEQFTYVP